MNLPPGSRDLVRIVFGMFLIVLLIGRTLWILSPFLPALIWATMIVVATWPLLLRLQHALGGLRTLAAVAMTALLSLDRRRAAHHRGLDDRATGRAAVGHQGRRDPDSDAADLDRGRSGRRRDADRRVARLRGGDAGGAGEQGPPYMTAVVDWIAVRAGNFGTFLLHLALTLLLCGVLYVTGETAALGVRRFARRLQGEAGDHLVLLAAGSIRAVALGIVVTAIVQTALGAVGLVVAGVPTSRSSQP